jgi:protein-disulfide isomerase
MQPGACELAWAAEAARLQGCFWPFHDALLAAGPLAPAESIAEAARRAHLDPARFDADRRSDDARIRVAEDVALGSRLQIPGTPTVFLDGRLVGSVRSEVIEILVRHELGPQAAASWPHGREIMGLGRLRHEGRPS